MKKNKAGLSIVASLVGMVLLSAAMMAIIQISRMAGSSHRALSSRTELADVMKQLSIFLGDAAACKAYFENRTFDPTLATLSSQVISPIQITYPSDATKIFLEAGSKIHSSGISIDEVSLRGFVFVSAGTYTAKLSVGAVLQNKLRVMRKISVKLATVNVDATTERVTACTNTPMGVPTGAVMAFNLAACPVGWAEYVPARGRVVGGTNPDTTNGLSVRNKDASVGEEEHTLTISEMPSHNHRGAYDLDKWAGVQRPGDAMALRVDGGFSGYMPRRNRGGNQPHNNMQPTVFLLYCEKS